MNFIEEQKKNAKCFEISDQMIEKYIVESTVCIIKQKISFAINCNKNNVLIIGIRSVPMDRDYDSDYGFAVYLDSIPKDYLEYNIWDYYNGGYKTYASLASLYNSNKDLGEFCSKYNLDYSSFMKKIEDFDKRVISGNITLNNIEKKVYQEVMNLGVKNAEICMKFGWMGYKRKSIFSFSKTLLNSYKIYFDISW